jgi:hypothetical protein
MISKLLTTEMTFRFTADMQSLGNGLEEANTTLPASTTSTPPCTASSSCRLFIFILYIESHIPTGEGNHLIDSSISTTHPETNLVHRSAYTGGGIYPPQPRPPSNSLDFSAIIISHPSVYAVLGTCPPKSPGVYTEGTKGRCGDWEERVEEAGQVDEGAGEGWGAEDQGE